MHRSFTRLSNLHDNWVSQISNFCFLLFPDGHLQFFDLHNPTGYEVQHATFGRIITSFFDKVIEL